ncbi:hypothetical protein TTHERM_00129990 (macronuclear) [Tetrahymena thermophila SB210]|uniref:Uncharacterized protein n=1 Tax=Tetrahymena thermophila (strain SB210) TaxID=312017 RepID=I7MEF3_TETTS|nr:hypothetical protein TTHERM_00129990 [Tetrahymena thermophila SB210]EAR96222.1 hypothetical protein TTHERM_00129990 [Tetrahymena thermophila SB210]|eukprot:XP_001016467.1 hypothetical protein TTHERM_00129990 [Tetrahymena thermophila SB210]
MKPITIRQHDQLLVYDKQNQFAEIKITSFCQIKQQLFEFYLNQISSVKTLKIDINEIYLSQKDQSSTFYQLRDLLMLKVTGEMKNLEKISIKYYIQDLYSQNIKKVVQFIQNTQNCAKVIEDCSVQIVYKKSLMHLDNILESINKYFSCIAGNITSFTLRLQSDIGKESLLSLSQLLLLLKNVKKFTFQASSSLNLKTDENLGQFIQSMNNIIKSTHSFIFDMKEASYQRGVISSITEYLSLLISQGSEELKTVIIDLEKVGWTFERQKMIKPNFVFGIATQMHKWPKSIQHLTINLDRALSFNENIVGDNVKLLLEGIHQIIPQLQTFSLNLDGIGFSMNEFQVNFAEILCSLFNNAKKLTDIQLNLQGHLDLTLDQWTQLFQSITNVPCLKKLILGIERWKNYTNDFEARDQRMLINTFLDNLYKNHNKSLKQFHFNIDDWQYLQSFKSEYAQKLMKFDFVDDFQLLYYKSTNDDSLKNLQLIEVMGLNKKQEIYKQILLKKLGLQLPKQSAIEFEYLQSEYLDKHVKYFLQLHNQISQDSPTFSSVKIVEE